MDLIIELLRGGSIPIITAIAATVALIWIYRDSRAERATLLDDAKKEREERQRVMDKMNAQWLALYKESLEETAELRKEMSKTRDVITELKGVIKGLYDQGLQKLK